MATMVFNPCFSGGWRCSCSTNVYNSFKPLFVGSSFSLLLCDTPTQAWTNIYKKKDNLSNTRRWGGLGLRISCRSCNTGCRKPKAANSFGDTTSSTRARIWGGVICAYRLLRRSQLSAIKKGDDPLAILAPLTSYLSLSQAQSGHLSPVKLQRSPGEIPTNIGSVLKYGSSSNLLARHLRGIFGAR